MPCDITYMWNLKYDTNSMKQNQWQREQTGGCQGGGHWRRDGVGGGVSRCKLLYIDWINKVLLNRMEKYIQYPMINRNGKEYFKKKNIYMYN